jgi:hypothetical protein
MGIPLVPIVEGECPLPTGADLPRGRKTPVGNVALSTPM